MSKPKLENKVTILTENERLRTMPGSSSTFFISLCPSCGTMTNHRLITDVARHNVKCMKCGCEHLDPTSEGSEDEGGGE